MKYIHKYRQYIYPAGGVPPLAPHARAHALGDSNRDSTTIVVVVIIMIVVVIIVVVYQQ